MMNGHRASFLASRAARCGGRLSLTRTAGSRQRSLRRWRLVPRALARPDDYRAADSSPARSAIACNVRTVVSMSSVLNWLSSRIRGAAT
jgi:hypothetical protein